MTRSKVVALVGGLSALGGAVAGAVAATIATVAAVLVLGEMPVSAARIAVIVAQNGALRGRRWVCLGNGCRLRCAPPRAVGQTSPLHERRTRRGIHFRLVWRTVGI